jgi:oxygen-dependent protoporphyrinogen oxidase
MLADALHQSIEQTSPERLHQSPSEGATHITWEANQKTWHVTSADGVQWQTQCLVMACQLPSWETLLEPVLGQYPEALAAYKEVKTQTPYSSLAIVQLGVHGTALAHTLKGFGALVSRSKDRSEKSLRLLGSLWPSSMFPHRSPEGYHLLANFYGGAMDAEVLTWDDEALIQKCLEELHCLGILKSPVYASARYKLVRVHRAHQAIPQSTVGHRQRVANLKSVLSSYYAHHFHMVGSWSHGVSVTDCLAAGKATAHTLWQHLSQHDEDPPLPH